MNPLNVGLDRSAESVIIWIWNITLTGERGTMLKPLGFLHNKKLFGWNDTPGIVAIEPDGDSGMRIYRRIEGRLTREQQRFQPILWLANSDLLSHFKGQYETHKLRGELFYQYLALFNSLSTANDARRHLIKITGKNPSDKDAPYYWLSDPVHQHLLLTGQTFFKGMNFSDVRRLQLDIETYCAPGFEFSVAQREQDQIIAIALSDSTGWETILWGKDLSEKQILEKLNELIAERDPDVIEGHNIFKFDLNYIKTRADRWGVPLRWGRDGSEAVSDNSRMFIAERTIDYDKWEVEGRHIVDTWILSQFYDVITRDLESLTLKEMAKHFDLASEDRTYIEGSQISPIYDTDPDRLRRYALDDVRETRALSKLLSQSYFIQAQIFPYSYQNTIVRGNATRINSLFLREYLRERHSLPAPPSETREFAGGYTEIREEGVLERVLHCDVTSLYPSVMLAHEVKPTRDTLNVFLPLLADLRRFRVEAKRLANQAAQPEEKAHFQSLQSTFKILINSFYGYLGTSISNFADFNAAARVTEIGRALVQQMIDWLKTAQCRVIEIDTDGIYFVPPASLSSPEEEEALIQQLGAALPTGIEVELDGRYKAMLSYKMKNYALLTHSGKLILKGSGLRSRGLERFQRDFLRELIRLVLSGEGEKVRPFYHHWLKRMDRHDWKVTEFAKTESLSESLPAYQQKVSEKKRNPSALYELALKSGRNYQPGDQLSYYVTGNKKNVKAYEACKLASQWDPAHPDENIPYYQAKLKELFEKFEGYLPPEKPMNENLTLF
jgi:DNA polymerase, archaea type